MLTIRNARTHYNLNDSVIQAYAFARHSIEYIHWKFLKQTQAKLIWNVHIQHMAWHGTARHSQWICTATTMATMKTTMNWMALISMQHHYLYSTHLIHSTLKSVGLYSIHSIFSSPSCLLYTFFFINRSLVFSIPFNVWREGGWEREGNRDIRNWLI